MSKRLQVLLDESVPRAVRHIARQLRMTVAEWVRSALRAARSIERSRTIESKIAVVRAAARHEFPTADIDGMLAEIGQGYNGAPRP